MARRKHSRKGRCWNSRTKISATQTEAFIAGPVDLNDEDFEWFSQYEWYAEPAPDGSGYYSVRFVADGVKVTKLYLEEEAYFRHHPSAVRQQALLPEYVMVDAWNYDWLSQYKWYPIMAPDGRGPYAVRYQYDGNGFRMAYMHDEIYFSDRPKPKMKPSEASSAKIAMEPGPSIPLHAWQEERVQL